MLLKEEAGKTLRAPITAERSDQMTDQRICTIMMPMPFFLFLVL